MCVPVCVCERERVQCVHVCLLRLSLHSSVFKQHQPVATIVDQKLADHYGFVFIPVLNVWLVSFSPFSLATDPSGVPQGLVLGPFRVSKRSFIITFLFNLPKIQFKSNCCCCSTIINVWGMFRVNESCSKSQRLNPF